MDQGQKFDAKDRNIERDSYKTKKNKIQEIAHIVN